MYFFFDHNVTCSVQFELELNRIIPCTACLGGIPSIENCRPARKKYSMFNTIKTRDDKVQSNGM